MKQEAERASQNQECQENKCSGAEERTKDACKPPKTAPLSPLQLPTPPAHPATADQSDAVLHNLPIETVSQDMPGREGSRCRQIATLILTRLTPFFKCGKQEGDLGAGGQHYSACHEIRFAASS